MKNKADHIKSRIEQIISLSFVRGGDDEDDLRLYVYEEIELLSLKQQLLTANSQDIA